MEIYLFAAAIFIIAALFFLLWRAKTRADAQAIALAEVQTRLEEAQRARTEFDEQLLALTRATSDGILRVDEQGNVVEMNETARALLGLADGTKGSLRHLAWGYDFDSLVNQVLSGASDNTSQTVVKDERAFQVHAVALEKENQRSALVAITEITELQRLGRARREFVANISHELRTPVTSLQLLGETITDETLNDKNLLRDLLGKIRTQVDLLKQLTDELMDLALIESGQAPIRLVNYSAAELVGEAIAPLLPQVERKEIVMDTHIAPDLTVLADPNAMRKVISNLTHNAIKFTPQGGQISIRASYCNNRDDVQFAISDTGSGIPEQDLPRIFERFYKVDRARTRTQGELRGTGLGLAIAKHIVEAHGGKIWAESKAGKGSIFYFTLPSSD